MSPEVSSSVTGNRCLGAPLQADTLEISFCRKFHFCSTSTHREIWLHHSSPVELNVSSKSHLQRNWHILRRLHFLHLILYVRVACILELFVSASHDGRDEPADSAVDVQYDHPTAADIPTEPIHLSGRSAAVCRPPVSG